ncbi:MAG TPA: N-acetylmuramic acid 6-phosphate etherase [Symbiobacteriaceae bacterium]|jgi:N-acetylmuramic acid 6-phosphate etherase|nr:N-acetylmuramic acid 6-phosphate etherase [Symbiobacteriaceae bacterium]
MAIDLSKLVTESRLQESLQIDQVDTETMVRIINDQDQLVALAVQKELPNIARAIDLIADRLRQGGRLFYVGAGTSGRLGVLDASEIPPTYGASSDLVQGVIAGGWKAVFETQEGAEDSEELGARDLGARAMAHDAVVGIAASGRTPYTVAALQEAKRRGCVTVAVTNNPNSPLAQVADVTIAPVVGPEVVMGSTRMKSGTAQKLVLNMISTGCMIKLGKVYTNLMVDMQASNEKLRKRAARMVMLAAEVDEATAQAALDRCHSSAKLAIVSLKAGVDAAEAERLLAQAEGFVHKAINLAGGQA